MQRPQRILVFGIVCLVYGAGSVMVNAGELVAALVGPDMMEKSFKQFRQQDPSEDEQAKIDALRKPTYRTLSGLESALSLAMAGVLITAGVGLLKDRRFGLRLARLWAYFGLGATVMSTVLFANYVFPEMPASAQGGVGAAVVMMIMVLWAVPILLLTVLSRPVVADYLAAREKARQQGVSQQGPAMPFDRGTQSPTHSPTDSSPSSTGPDADPTARPTTRPSADTWRDDPWNDPGSR